MKIKHDYSYLNNRKKLIDRGYAELDIHSINFSGSYNKLIQIQNWIANTKYNIYNITENLTYRDNWDFYYYSNKGWNNKDTFDFFRLSPNGNRDVASNSILINELLEDLQGQLRHLKESDVKCRIQYTARIKEELLKSKAMELKKNLEGKTIEYQGMFQSLF